MKTQYPIFSLFIFLFTFTSCDLQEFVAEEAGRPNFDRLDLNLKDYKFQFGDEIELKTGGVRAVVLNLGEKSGVPVYEICFLSNNKLFGFSAPMNNQSDKCVDKLEFIYIGEREILEFNKIRNLGIDIEKVRWGRKSAGGDIGNLKLIYEDAVEKRAIILPCQKESKPVPRYFHVENFKK